MLWEEQQKHESMARENESVARQRAILESTLQERIRVLKHDREQAMASLTRERERRRAVEIDAKELARGQMSERAQPEEHAAGHHAHEAEAEDAYRWGDYPEDDEYDEGANEGTDMSTPTRSSRSHTTTTSRQVSWADEDEMGTAYAVDDDPEHGGTPAAAAGDRSQPGQTDRVLIGMLEMMRVERERAETERLEAQARAEERQHQLILELRQLDENKRKERAEDPGLPIKLRLDGVPRWPPRTAGGVYPFCIFAEDFTAALKY
jgi:hypothetical protein